MMKIVERYSEKAIKYININKLKNKTIAIDANLFIYKSIFAIRGNIGFNFDFDSDGDGESKLHIYIMFIRLYGLYKWNIKPIFVFDFAYPKMKDKCIIDRKNKKDEYKKKYLIEKNKLMKKKYYNLCSSITQKEYNDIIKLIKLFGFTYIFSKEEADSQCAYISKKGFVDYVISDDSDLLLFGCKNIIKNFTLNEKKKMKVINLSKILDETKLKMKSFIQLGILLGCDYVKTVPGIGYVKAFELIKKYKTIKKAQLNEIIPKSFIYEDVYDYFLHGKYKKIYKKDLKIIKPNIDYLKKFMYDNGFEKNNIVNKYICLMNL